MVTPYFTPVRGGITSFVRGLSDALRDKGVKVSIVARDAESAPGVVVVRRNSQGFARSAARWLRELRPDAIHAHAHWYALLAALRASRPRSVTFSFHTEWPALGPLEAYVTRRMLARCRSVTFPSRHLRSTFPGRIPEAIVSIIPPGTRETRADPSSARAWIATLGGGRWASTVCYVGKFEWPTKVKGFQILLDAMTRPVLRYAGLLVAGGGSQLAAAESEARRLGLSERVRFLGDVADPERIYVGCDVYCHSSLQEGLSLSVLEAMRVGAPIVGFRLPFMEEALEDGVQGLLVEPNADSLATAISKLLVDRSLSARLGSAAKERARTQYDWQAIAHRFLEVYGVAR